MQSGGRASFVPARWNILWWWRVQAAAGGTRKKLSMLQTRARDTFFSAVIHRFGC